MSSQFNEMPPAASTTSPDFAAGPSLQEDSPTKIQNPFDAFLANTETPRNSSWLTSMNDTDMVMDALQLLPPTSTLVPPRLDPRVKEDLGFDPETYSYDEEMGAIYEQAASKLAIPLRTLSEEESYAATTASAPATTAHIDGTTMPLAPSASHDYSEDEDDARHLDIAPTTSSDIVRQTTAAMVVPRGAAVVVEDVPSGSSEEDDDPGADQLEARIMSALPNGGTIPPTALSLSDSQIYMSESDDRWLHSRSREESGAFSIASMPASEDVAVVDEAVIPASTTSPLSDDRQHIVMHPFSYASSEDDEHDAFFADTTDDEEMDRDRPYGPIRVPPSTHWNQATPAVGISAVRMMPPVTTSSRPAAVATFSPSPHGVDAVLQKMAPTDPMYRPLARSRDPMVDSSATTTPINESADEVKSDPAKRYRSYYGCMIGIGLALFIVGVVLLLYFLLDRSEDEAAVVPPPDMSPAPTRAPTPATEVDPLLQLLQNVSTDGGVALNTPASAQRRAWEWLGADPNLLQYDTHQRVVRYALATFYFSTGGHRGNETTTDKGTTTWIQKDYWLSYEHHECEWYTRTRTGLCGTVNGSHVVLDLDVSYNNLQGTLPPEIGLLSTLRNFRVGGGPDTFLSGSLPSEMGQWTALEELRLPQNALTGRIPSTLGRCTGIQSMDLSDNELRGLIPSELGQLSQLYLLTMHQNSFVGPIPSDLSQCTRLRTLNLAENQLSWLPKDIFQLSLLTSLDVQRNELEGSLVSNIGQIKNISSLNLSFNRLDGSLPVEIGTLSLLTELDLSHNTFNGTIPSLWFDGNYSGSNATNIFASIPQPNRPLRSLRLHNNQLFGSIPESLAYASNLQTLDLYANALTGSMPLRVCEVVNVTHATVSVDCPAVTCPCCTQCCGPRAGEQDVVCACRYWNTTLEWLCY
jgi:hypothetical protein